MAEYIEREAAIEAMKKAPVAFMGTVNALMDLIEDIPAADVRPMVLCRDCKYFSELMYEGTQLEYGYCDRWADGTRMNNDDFCSHAEKRE